MKHDPITGSSSIVQLGKKFADSLGLDENQQAMHYIVFLLNNFHSALISPSGPLTHLEPSSGGSREEAGARRGGGCTLIFGPKPMPTWPLGTKKIKNGPNIS